MADQSTTTNVALPRVAITYCTQCRWMLRAGYFGQELLSTFGTSIGEVALIPATGGLFTVHLTYKPDTSAAEPIQVLIWDRKAEGGFPETKILKQRVRNHIEPEKNLGHSDTPSKSATGLSATPQKETDGGVDQKVPNVVGGESAAPTESSNDCEDCK